MGGSGQGLGDFLSSLVDSAGTESADGIVFVVKGEAGCGSCVFNDVYFS